MGFIDEFRSQHWSLQSTTNWSPPATWEPVPLLPRFQFKECNLEPVSRDHDPRLHPVLHWDQGTRLSSGVPSGCNVRFENYCWNKITYIQDEQMVMNVVSTCQACVDYTQLNNSIAGFDTDQATCHHLDTLHYEWKRMTPLVIIKLPRGQFFPTLYNICNFPRYKSYT